MYSSLENSGTSLSAPVDAPRESAKNILPFAGAALAAALLAGPSVAQAEEPPAQWGEMQVLMGLHADSNVFRASAMSLSGMKSRFHTTFLYVGRGFTVDTPIGPVWIAPHAGVVNNMLGDQWALTSLWAAYSRDKLNIFGEFDLYGNAKDLATYGVVFADYELLEPIKVGAQVECFDGDCLAAPRVGVMIRKEDPKIYSTLQWNVPFQENPVMGPRAGVQVFF